MICKDNRTQWANQLSAAFLSEYMVAVKFNLIYSFNVVERGGKYNICYFQMTFEIYIEIRI